MPTDTIHCAARPARFVVWAVLGSLGFFGVFRLTWIASHVTWPVTRLQSRLAGFIFGAPSQPVEVTLACSGTDAVALCLAAVLAYPAPWQTRVAGAGGGLVLILALNTLRIGSLGRVAGSETWFTALHLYVWPAVLTLAIAGYAWTWMRLVDRPHRARGHQRERSRAAASEPVRLLPARFIALGALFLVVFLAAAPWYLQSPSVLALAGLVARAAAVILGAAGIDATVAANGLWTPRGGFLVTQECIATPLIPIYLAAVCACSMTWQRRMFGLAAAVPLFIVLGIARLLVVALPGTIASPLFFVHAFFQLVLGAVVIMLAALWRHRRQAFTHAAAGVAAGVGFLYLLGPLYSRAVMAMVGTPLNDVQGAIAFLPSFQTGLYSALWIAACLPLGWRRFLAGLGVLALTQVAVLAALHGLTAHFAFTAHVRDIRGWAIAGPLLMVAAVMTRARATR